MLKNLKKAAWNTKYHILQYQVMYYSLFILRLCSICWTITLYHIIAMMMIRKYVSSLPVMINVSQLSTVFNDVQTWMLEWNLKLRNYKTSIMEVGNPLQIRNFDLPSSLTFDQSKNKFPAKLRSLGVAFDENSTLKYYFL